MNTKLVMGLALALACTPAIAESGFYAGLGIGQVTLEDNIGNVDLEGTDTGFKIFGGYRIDDHFAVEAAYIDAGTPDDTVFGVDIESDASALQASAIGTLPIGPRFGMYLRGSVIAWEAETTATNGFSFATQETDGTDFAYGIGGIFSVAANFSVRAEFEGADLDGTDLQLLSVSGLFRC